MAHKKASVVVLLPLLLAGGWFLLSLPRSATSDIVWKAQDSPHLIRQDFTVRSGDKLTIEPGSVVMAAAEAGLIVEGVLRAHRVTFTALAGEWKGIVLKNPDNKERSLIQHCLIEKAQTAILITSSSPDVINNTIRKNQYGIIAERTGASPNIVNNLVTENQHIGVGCFPNSLAHVTGNTITKNRVGLKMGWSSSLIARNNIMDNELGIDMNFSSPHIIENVITNNSIGIQSQQESVPLVLENAILSNGVNLRNTDLNITVVAQYNWWGTTDQAQISRTLEGKILFLPFLSQPPEWFNSGPGSSRGQ
jgi:parallel beta-helix repeat protein